MTDDTLGELEEMILLAILHLGDEAYGVPIIREIERRTGREVAPPPVYVALRRLRTRGLLRSWMSKPEPVQGGRARRYFAVAEPGLDLLARARRRRLAMWDGLQPLLDER